jgi:transposase
MIQITPHMKFWAAVDPIDFRKGMDGIAEVCRSKLNADPFSGAVFLFRNGSGTTIKILVYDGQGFWLMAKRLSEGKFKWWPTKEGEGSLSAQQVSILLWNGDPERAQMQQDWRRIA